MSEEIIETFPINFYLAKHLNNQMMKNFLNSGNYLDIYYKLMHVNQLQDFSKSIYLFLIIFPNQKLPCIMSVHEQVTELKSQVLISTVFGNDLFSFDNLEENHLQKLFIGLNQNNKLLMNKDVINIDDMKISDIKIEENGT